MEIVMEKSTGTKSAWAELEHFVLKREKQWQNCNSQQLVSVIMLITLAKLV